MEARSETPERLPEPASDVVETASIMEARSETLESLPEPASDVAVEQPPQEAATAEEKPRGISANVAVSASAPVRPGIRRPRLTETEKACPKCGKRMRSRAQLQQHLNRVYPCDANTNPPSTEVEPAICSKPPMALTSQVDVKMRMS